jgi:hypothetical protein
VVSNPTDQRAKEIFKELVMHPDLGRYVDSNYPIPRVYRGKGEVRIVILGQDPTVKNEKSRTLIKTVLNLDRSSHLRRYLSSICDGLGLDLDENVYATNYIKNFFVHPPTQIKEINILETFTPFWLPLLKDELSQFPSVPVIILGQPLLRAVINQSASPNVRDYWGYRSDWKEGRFGELGFLKPWENILDRRIFPFPHQPSLRKQFYRERLDQYIAFCKEQFR